MAAGLARANGVIFTAMPLALAQVHRLLVADRARDSGVIRRAIAEVLAANPETSLLEIETALRDGAAQAHLIASGAGLSIVFGFPAWRAALDKVGRTPEQNRQALITPPAGLP
jgi:hypothetical protein